MKTTDVSFSIEELSDRFHNRKLPIVVHCKSEVDLCFMWGVYRTLNYQVPNTYVVFLFDWDRKRREKIFFIQKRGSYWRFN